MAKEAAFLARQTTSPAMRAGYVVIQKEWMTLAADIERSENPYAGLDPSQRSATGASNGRISDG